MFVALAGVDGIPRYAYADQLQRPLDEIMASLDLMRSWQVLDLLLSSGPTAATFHFDSLLLSRKGSYYPISIS